MQTWEEVPLSSVGDRKLVGNKWVFDTKTDKSGNIIKYKAQLVAKGYTLYSKRRARLF